MHKNNQSLDCRNTYECFDLVKFICSIAIIAIHASLYPKVLYPWLRLAVPIFFTISSYLLFSKLDKLSLAEQRGAVFKFVKRNLILYLVWFVIQLPVTLDERSDWFNNGTLSGILTMIKNFFFGSTFLASWFIMANIIAVVIVFLCSKLNIWCVLSASALLNVLCVLVSGYKNILPWVSVFADAIEPYVGNIVFNFVVALFWVSLGKAFAFGKIKIKRPIAIFGLICSVIMLYLERVLTEHYMNLTISRDCYFMLMPVVIFTFSLLPIRNLNLKNTVFLRKSSTLIYVTHYPMITFVNKAYGIFSFHNALITFLTVVLIEIVLCIVIITLSNIKTFKFLRYLY